MRRASIARRDLDDAVLERVPGVRALFRVYHCVMAERAEPAPAAAGPVSGPAAAPGGAPVSMGQFTALGGPTSEDVVLRMQERVGNQATTEWLSHAVPPRNVAAPMAGPAHRAWRPFGAARARKLGRPLLRRVGLARRAAHDQHAAALRRRPAGGGARPAPRAPSSRRSSVEGLLAVVVRADQHPAGSRAARRTAPPARCRTRRAAPVV